MGGLSENSGILRLRGNKVDLIAIAVHDKGLVNADYDNMHQRIIPNGCDNIAKCVRSSTSLNIGGNSLDHGWIDMLVHQLDIE